MEFGLKVVSTKLTNTEWEKLLDECNRRGVSIAELVRDVLMASLGGKVFSQPARKKSLLERLVDEAKQKKVMEDEG